MRITKFQKWVLRWIFRDIVVQGPHHEDNIIECYEIMKECAREEFREDNDVTLNEFLSDCHGTSLGPISERQVSQTREERFFITGKCF